MNFLAFCQLFGVMSRSRLQERLKLLYILHAKKLTNQVGAPDEVTREDKMKKQDIGRKTTKLLPFQQKKLCYYLKLVTLAVHIHVWLLTMVTLHLRATTLYCSLSSVSLAISKPEEGPEHTEEDVEETQKSYCDTELVEDEVNTSSEELNPAGMEGRDKW